MYLEALGEKSKALEGKFNPKLGKSTVQGPERAI